MKDYNAENNLAVWFDISVADLDRAQNFYEPVLNIKIFRDKYNDFEFCVLDHEKCNGGCLIPNPNEILADKGIMVYLVDSGGQYLDGTTDITRTVAIGSPIDFTKKAFTLVLKGHIALASAQFPEGIGGQHLDTLARQFLWHEGLDFDHGTGHGVGSYLNVHEGPHRIGKGSNKVPLKEGMVVSNEPGYYEEGQFGIRIENLIFVKQIDIVNGKKLLAFENFTFVPVDSRLLNHSILTPKKDWLNAYHAEVFEKVSPHVKGEVLEWLENVVQKI